MLNNYADSGGGFNSNHGQAARTTDTQKQQNLGASWSYNSQLEGIYYGNEHPQPMYMGPYDGSNKHAAAGYPQYPSGTLVQPVPTQVVQCRDTCCQHYDNRYPVNPAPLRYQSSGPLQTRYSDVPNSESRQYFPERRPVQVNLPRKKVYPSENGYTVTGGVSDRHYSQYMGRGQSAQQMQVQMRPQYPVYPHYWNSSRGWAGARVNCPPPSYHQSVNQSAQVQPGTKIPDGSQYMDPSLHKSRGVGSNTGKLDIIRPVPDTKRPAMDSSLQSCYEYGYTPGFLPFSEVNKMQGKSLNPQSMSAQCKIPAEKQYLPQQMQYPYPNNERNLISYGNPSNDPGYPMNFPLPSNDIHTRPDLEEGQQASSAQKLSTNYESSGKKSQDLDLRQYLTTWDDDEDESARLSEPPLAMGSTANPYIVVECSTLESEAAAKLQERFKPLTTSQDCSTKPRGGSPSSDLKRSNEPHPDLHSQTTYAPSMPTLLSDSDKNVNFWNGINKDGDSVIGKGGAFQPLDCSKRDSNINAKVVSQREALPPAHKVLCNSEPNTSFDGLVSFYGDNRRVSGGYDLVEMSERLVNSSDKSRIDQQASSELTRPCDPRLQQSQHTNNPSMYDKFSSRFSANNYQHFKGAPTDPYYNYKHPMTSSEKYYGYENPSIVNSTYDYNKCVSEFDNTRLFGNKEFPKDPRRALYGDSQTNPENTLIEPLAKPFMPNCFQEKTSLQYTSLEPEQFMNSPIIEKSIESQMEPRSRQNSVIEDRLNQPKANLSHALSTDTQNQVKPEKTVLVTSQNCPPEIFKMTYSPKKEIPQKDNVVTLHSGDQSEDSAMTVEVPYVQHQQYSSLVKLSEEISRSESSDENKESAVQEDKATAEEIKKPTCFKLKRLPNSKEWAVEGNENTDLRMKEGMCSPKTEAMEDSDTLKTTVSVSNLNMPSLDDIRDGEDNCEVLIENHSKTKVIEGVLCSSKSTTQPPQLAIVQPMKLVTCEGKSPEQNLKNEENKTKQALKAFRSFHSHNLNGESFNDDKPITITDCSSEIEGIKTDISKHENFRSHKKIQGDFASTFPNCLSSPNEEFSHSQDVNSETTKQQYSPFHIYSDCQVNSQIPDFFKLSQRSSANEKNLDKQIPTSPGVDGMFEDINHSSSNQLCHNQIYQRKSCHFQDLSMPSFDNHNSHFQSFSSIFAEDSNNKGRCDGSVLQMGDKKYLKNLLDDIECQQVSNTLEERVSKLKSNFMNDTLNDNKASEAKKSPPIPPINLKLNESKKVWCITNKDQHLSLSDFSENSSPSLTSKALTTEKGPSPIENKIDQEKYLIELAPEEANRSCYRNEDILVPPDKNLNDIGYGDKIEKPHILDQLPSEKIGKVVCASSENISSLQNINATSASVSSSIDPTNKAFSVSEPHPLTDFNHTTGIRPPSPKSNKQSHSLSIVKYYPRYEILKGNGYNDGKISQNILIFDEKGTHFPQERNNDDSHGADGKTIATDIVELLITNVFSWKEIAGSLENEPASAVQDKYMELEEVNSNQEKNLETVIKYDKSSSSSKSFNGQNNITKTTEIFIECEKVHNQHSSVIKAIQSEKCVSSLDDRKNLIRSIFSPMPDDGKDNNPGSLYSIPSVANNFTKEKDSFNFDLIENKDESEKMDVDVAENCDENQPLDYSLGDATTHKSTSTLNGYTSENVTTSNSEDSCNIDSKEVNDLGNIKCCSGDFGVSENTRHITENNNSESFTVNKLNNIVCSTNPLQGVDSVFVSNTESMAEKIKDQSTNLNGETLTTEDSSPSDKSNFESDFDVSDSEPTNEKETLAKEPICLMDVCPFNEQMDSNCILGNEHLQTDRCKLEKESSKITIYKIQQNGDQSILKDDQLTPKEPSNVPVVSIEDNPVDKYVENNSESDNQEESSLTKESLSLSSYSKDTNTFQDKELMSYLLKEESLKDKSENPKDPLNSSDNKTKESLTPTSSYNYLHVNEGSIPKVNSDERSETSVIVRNNTFTSIINNHCKELCFKYSEKMETKVINSGFSSSKSTVRVSKEIPNKNEETSIISVLKPKSNDDTKSTSINQISEPCQLITNNISDDANEDENMDIESVSSLQTSAYQTKELSAENTSVATKNFEDASNNWKSCYCVSESIFLNTDEGSVLCLKKYSPSYLFDFKRRKVLKFCKSDNELQFLLNKNNSSCNRDFSNTNFGMNAQVCSTSAVFGELTNPNNKMFKRKHCDNALIETNQGIQGLADEVKLTSWPQDKENTNDPRKLHFDPPHSFNPLYAESASEEIFTKSNHVILGEDSAVLRPNKNKAHLKSKLSLSEEENSFCERRDSLKIMEPEAVLKEIFSPDPEIKNSESKENYLSSNLTKDNCNSLSNSGNFSLLQITSSDLTSVCIDLSIENKGNTTDSSQGFADENCPLLNSAKNELLISTDLSASIADESSERECKAYSTLNNEKLATKSLSNTEDGLKSPICKEEQFSFIDADILDKKTAMEDHQNSLTSSLEDSGSLDISCKSLSENDSESHGYFTDSVTCSNQTSLLYPSKSVECSNQNIASKLQNEDNDSEECLESKVKNIEDNLSQEKQISTVSVPESAPQDSQSLSCQTSNLDNLVNHSNDSEQSISSMGIVTGRDVLFSSRFLEDEEDKELNSELHSENRSRKSSVEEESILDCPNLKMSSTDSLRGSGGHLSSETFPLQCLVEAALALENVDSKQMLSNSSGYSGMYSQSSQSLIKSTIGDVHPNDIEDFPDKNSLTNSNSDPNICKETKLTAADREIFSKFEENNYNLRASTKIVTSSSSNIIPYSKRYYKLKRQKQPKPPLDKINKSEILIKKIQTKKRKDVFSYSRSKRRKKVIKDKPKYQKLKKQQDFPKKSSENSYTEISFTDGSTQHCESEMTVFVKEVPGSSTNKREDTVDYYTNQSVEAYGAASHQGSAKSNFGGPLIIASENSPVENNIFCVHVNSEKMDEYVHDLNIGGLDLLSEHHQSVFKENSIEEQSETADVSLENGTSLVIIIEQLGENRGKENYFKGDSDVILSGIEETSPLPQPNAVLDYSSDNLTSEVSVNESFVCPSDPDNDTNCQKSALKDPNNSETVSSMSYKSYEMNSGKSETYDKYSAECNQELLTTNCYEEINETLVNDIGNWPFVEEEVAEFNTKSVSPNRIPEEGRKIELKCSLPWNKIFNMTKTKKKKNKMSQKVSGLELGPAKVEVRLRAPSTEWKVISDYAENSSPVVKVSRLILQRESETSSYSEKDSEEENENRKLLSPSSNVSELKDNSDSNDVTKNLIEDESWQPVVLLTRDKDLDELTRSKTRYKEFDKVTHSKTRDKELVEYAFTLESQLLSEKSHFTGISSQNNEDVNNDDSGSESSGVDCNSSKHSKSNENPQANFENIQTDLFNNFPEKRNVYTKHQSTKTDKGCTYETYSPSRHDGSYADETVYSPSDPHYSPEPGFLYSDSSSCVNKNRNYSSSESDISPTENHYKPSHQVNFESFDTFIQDDINKVNDIHRNGGFTSKSSLCRVTTESVSDGSGDTSDTNCSSETQLSSSFTGSRHNLAKTISLQVNNQYVRPDLLDTPNIILSKETRNSVAEENLRKFKRKMPKNFFVRRKLRKNADNEINAIKKVLPEENLSERKPDNSPLLPHENSIPCSTESTLAHRRSSNSSEVEGITNEWQTGQSSALVEERLNSSKSYSTLASENCWSPRVDELKDSYPVRLNNAMMDERFEEKLRLRDGGRGLKRPCEGHSKEDTKRRRKNLRNHSNQCEECGVQFETKEELCRHAAQEHAAATHELHHCLLCQRSFSSAARHRLHVQGRSHRHLELTQRHTIHAVHRLLVGKDCPRIASLSSSELQALQWRPTQPGYSHVYHQLTPLLMVLQERESEASEEVND